MKCAECGLEIIGVGYWTTFNGKVREDYHPKCKPVYYWTNQDKTKTAKYPGINPKKD
jgi:hypothetical protein